MGRIKNLHCFRLPLKPYYEDFAYIKFIELNECVDRDLSYHQHMHVLNIFSDEEDISLNELATVDLLCNPLVVMTNYVLPAGWVDLGRLSLKEMDVVPMQYRTYLPLYGLMNNRPEELRWFVVEDSDVTSLARRVAYEDCKHLEIGVMRDIQEFVPIRIAMDRCKLEDRNFTPLSEYAEEIYKAYWDIPLWRDIPVTRRLKVL